MKGLKGILLVLILSPLLVWGLNCLIFPKNNGEKYVDEYINSSIEIEIEMSTANIDIKTIRVYTGVRFAFLRGKTLSKRIRTLSFYNEEYLKYFRLNILDSNIPVQFNGIYSLGLGNIIKAKVSQYDLNNPNYETKENPIPIFQLNIPKYEDNSSYIKARITDTQYRNTVEFYLSYMMSKDEFKERFEKE